MQSHNLRQTCCVLNNDIFQRVCTSIQSFLVAGIATFPVCSSSLSTFVLSACITEQRYETFLAILLSLTMTAACSKYFALAMFSSLIAEAGFRSGLFVTKLAFYSPSEVT